MDGGSAGLWSDPFPCQPGGCGTARTMAAPRMHWSALEMLTQNLGHSAGLIQLVPGSPGSDVRTPWDWHKPFFGTVCRGW